MKERVQNILGSLALGASLAMLSISMHSAQEYQPKTCDISGEGSEGLQNDDFCQRLLRHGYAGIRILRDERYAQLEVKRYMNILEVHSPTSLEPNNLRSILLTQLPQE